MEFLTLIVFYVAVILGLVLILLLGEWPMFRRTPISWCHWFLTLGLWQNLLYLVQRICGNRVIEVMKRVDDICCEQKNPAIQILYILMVIASYIGYYQALFTRLPSATLAYYHVYTGTVMAVLCLVTFILCSVSDPGTIKAENVSYLQSLFPYDEILFTRKRCGTCQIDKPARSKHCSVCRKCVAKFDHHCIWINNCVGLNNHRYFLLFLFVNLIATVYGGIAIPVFIYGEMAHIIHRRITHRGTGKQFTLAQRPLRLIEIISIRYPTLFALFMFTVGFSALLLGFLLFHLYLIATGKTTNESFKWKEVALKQPSARNIYDHGFAKNFLDVLFPFKRDNTYYANYEKAFMKLEKEEEIIHKRRQRRKADTNKATVVIQVFGAMATLLAAVYASWVFQQQSDLFTTHGRTLRLSLFLVIPVILAIIYKIILSVFAVMHDWDDKRLQKIQKHKDDMVKDLKDRNRYNKIQELLQKYDPEEKKKAAMLEMLQNQPPPTAQRIPEKKASLGGSFLVGAGRVIDSLANGIIGDQPELLAEIEKLRSLMQDLEEKNTALQRENAELQQRLSPTSIPTAQNKAMSNNDDDQSHQDRSPTDPETN